VIVAVTGASGNIGTAVVRGLVSRGHRVRGVARRPPDGSRSALTTDVVEWTAVDLTAPDARERLRTVFDGVDAVVHTAWGFQPTRNLSYLRRLDVGGSAAALAAAGECGVPLLVHVSSIGAYSPGRDPAPVDEDWPTDGAAPRLPYSRHKAAVERMLDAHEATGPPLPRVARVRPSLVARAEVGGSLGRYVLPSLLPSSLVRVLPVLPLDRRFRVQLTHSEDVAAGIVEVVTRGATGAFNLAAAPVLTRADVAEALGIPAVHLPWAALRASAAAAWAVRLQPVDPGWLDMARRVPTMSSERARRELDWQPRHDAREVLAEALAGLVAGSGADTPALRPRRWSEQLVHLLRSGPVSRRESA
jgi:nucleoside-diphosphate-sugar epimerase